MKPKVTRKKLADYGRTSADRVRTKHAVRRRELQERKQRANRPNVRVGAKYDRRMVRRATARKFTPKVDPPDSVVKILREC